MHFHLQAVANKAKLAELKAYMLSTLQLQHTLLLLWIKYSLKQTAVCSQVLATSGEPRSHYSAPGEQIIIPHCHKSQLLRRTDQSLST